MNRRRVLGAMVACGLLPGCLDRGGGGGEPGWYEVCEYAPGLAAGELPEDDHAALVHVRSAGEAKSAFAIDSLSDEARTTVEQFVEDTDFEAATLFYVQTRAPDACYGVRVESLARADGVLTGEVVAKDVSEPNEGCAEVVTTPALLARVRGDSGPPTRAELDVTNGWGETRTLESVTADEYDPGDDE